MIYDIGAMRTASRMLHLLFKKSIKFLVILTLVAGILQFSGQVGSISQFLSPEKKGALLYGFTKVFAGIVGSWPIGHKVHEGGYKNLEVFKAAYRHILVGHMLSSTMSQPAGDNW